jgi:hypothetical protein
MHIVLFWLSNNLLFFLRMGSNLNMFTFQRFLCLCFKLHLIQLNSIIQLCTTCTVKLVKTCAFVDIIIFYSDKAVGQSNFPKIIADSRSMSRFNSVHNIPEAHTAFGRDIIYLKYEAEALSSPRFIQPSNCIQFRTVGIMVNPNGRWV